LEPPSSGAAPADPKRDEKLEEEAADSAAPAEETLKLHVIGVDKYASAKKLTKSMEKHNVEGIKHIKKIPKFDWAVFSFENVAARDAALAKLNGLEVGGWPMKAKLHTANAAAPKRTASEAGLQEDGPLERKVPRNITGVVTPLHAMPYPEQLAHKFRSMERECLLKATRRLRGVYKKRQVFYKKTAGDRPESSESDKRAEMPDWLTKPKNEAPIKTGEIRGSPSQEGYRNKCDFTIGLDLGGVPRVGFCVGREKDGSVSVATISECLHVPHAMKALCVAMEAFLAASPLAPYKQGDHSGCWRGLMCRRSERTNESMAVVLVATSTVESAAWVQEKARLADSLGPLVSELFVQVYNGVSAPEPDDPVELIKGSQGYVTETLFGLKFRIVPGAFFQTNTAACEVLYRVVTELAQATEETTLLDVCCGTGSIGLCVASMTPVKQVIGVEMCAGALECAKLNAEANGVKNVKFVCSRAELVMQGLLNGQAAGPMVAIVDPPRSGLHRDVLASLRNCLPIKRLIYVSCNPTGSLVADLETLCGPRSKTLPGPCFVPSMAVPVDLFPSTDHCEMVIALERD